VAAVASILAAWLAAGTVLAGIGSLARPGSPARQGVAGTFWLGWAWTIGALGLWHFALPIDLRFTAAAVVAAALGYWRGRTAWVDVLRDAVRHPAPWIMAGAAAVWMAARALGDDTNGDDGFYHLQEVRWAASASLVPGLVNLQAGHPNQAFPLFAAAMEAGPLAHRGFHVVNGLLVLAMLARALAGLRSMLAGGRPAAADVLAAGFLAPAVDLALGRDLTSLTPDVAVFAAGAAFAVAAMEVLEQPAGPAARVVDLAVLGGAAVLAKQSAAPLVIATGAFVAAGELRASVRGGRPSAMPGVAAVAILFTGMLAVRGVVTTGFPFWPAAVAGLPVDWRVSSAHADRELGYLQALARGTAEGAGLAQWLATRASEILLDNRRVVVPAGLALLFGAGAAWLRRRAGAPDDAGLPFRVAMPAAVALVLWGATLPDPRYAGPLLWMLPGLAAGLGASRLPAGSVANYLRGAALAFAVCAATPFLEPRNRTLPAAAGPSAARVPETSPYRTRSGDVVSVPIEGTCWDAPPPCTVMPRPGLSFRVPGNPARGLRFEPGPEDAAARRP